MVYPDYGIMSPGQDQMPPNQPEQRPLCDIFVIGTASLDVLHFAGQTARTAGGAGMYTALAAARLGARVGLFAPRPDPLPAPLRPIAGRLHWLGPVIPPEALPRLEIEHHGGGRATLRQAAWGAEPQLTPDRLPLEVTRASIVHIAALSTARRQLKFLHALKKQRAGIGGQGLALGQSHPWVSVGTYARLVYGDREGVRRLFEVADCFFMNENEARGLFGGVEKARTRAGALLFVTLGQAGALVIEADRVTHIPGQPTTELDPTGAGDTFCGATLAGLVLGQSPLTAAQRAVALAAQTVRAVGPEALLRSK